MASTLESTKNKAKEVAVEDFTKAKDLATSAVKSGAYLYPIKGIVYFLTHRKLWKPLGEILTPTLSISVFVIALMFTVTYLPQLAVLVFVNGPLAAFTTILLVLSESSTLINFISRTFVIQEALVDTFDGVLVTRHQTAILAEGREVKSGHFNDPIAKLGKLIQSPFEKFTPKAIIRYLMYLPLNFIPVVGTVIFVLVQGKTRGGMVHQRYFQLKKWNSSQKDQWLRDNVAPYTAFGAVATVLELIPVFSIFFSFTNTVGAALWAADIEAKSTKMTELSDAKSAGESFKKDL